MKSKTKPARKTGTHFMRLIALGRFIYGLILFGLGLALFNLIGKNLASEVIGLISQWHIDSHLYYVHWLMQKVSSVSHGLLVLLTVGNFIYATVAFAEAVGLLMGQRWGYWLVIVDTASFIPIETYQMFKDFGWINLVLLIYYFATVVYLLLQIKRLPKQPT